MSAADLPVTDSAAGAILRVRVVPRSGRSRLAGVRRGALLIRLAAAPVDGAANDALVALVAETLGVARRAVRLVSGERSCEKRLCIEGTRAAQVAERLAPFLGAT